LNLDLFASNPDFLLLQKGNVDGIGGIGAGCDGAGGDDDHDDDILVYDAFPIISYLAPF